MISDFFKKDGVKVEEKYGRTYISYVNNKREITLEEANEFLDYIKENVNEIKKYLCDDFILVIEGYNIDGLSELPSNLVRCCAQAYRGY